MKKLAYLILIFGVISTSCRTQYTPTEEYKKYQKLLKASYFGNCKLTLQVLNGLDNNPNPTFLLTISHIEVSQHPFKVCIDPGYPAQGNLKIWRNGKLLSEYEPRLMVLYGHGLRIYESLDFTPGMSLSMKFNADERYGKSNIGRDKILGQYHIPGPFKIKGLYDVQFELLDEKHKLKSNKIKIKNNF